jgi:hypothetical protein
LLLLLLPENFAGAPRNNVHICAFAELPWTEINETT